MLFSYPPQARVGKTLPKKKIYEHARVSASLRQKIIKQVASITWEFKLSPETINLPATPTVPEIEVFLIELKGDDLSADVIRCVDTAIPFPVIYEVKSGNRIKVLAAYKRPSDADSSKWVTETYFETEWLSGSIEREPLLSSIDLGKLYENILIGMMPIKRRREEAFSVMASRAGEIRRLEREAESLSSKLHKEKQFNRKVELNAALRKLRQEIKELSH